MKAQPLLGIAIGDALGMPFETLPHWSSALTGWDGLLPELQAELLRLNDGKWLT